MATLHNGTDELNKTARGKWTLFLLCFLQMQIAMGLGALVCYLLALLVPASLGFAALYHPGTYLFAFGDVLYLTAPVVVWTLFRGYGWRRSAEMAVAMVVPVAAISVIGQLAGYAYLLWLIFAGYSAMSLGMLACMLYPRDHYVRVTGHSLHAASAA